MPSIPARIAAIAARKWRCYATPISWPGWPDPGGVRVWLATRATDMWRGMNTLALQIQEDLGRDPHAGDLHVFRGRRGDLVKILWTDGVGTAL